MKLLRYLSFFIFILMVFLPSVLGAQEIVGDKSEIVKAEVLEVLGQKNIIIPNTDTPGLSQTIRVKILEGDKSGEIITIENDYIMFEKGDKFFLFHSVDSFDGVDRYIVHDVNRSPVVIFFCIFIYSCCVIFFRQARIAVTSRTSWKFSCNFLYFNSELIERLSSCFY